LADFPTFFAGRVKMAIVLTNCENQSTVVKVVTREFLTHGV